jgi:hypothetical protein
MFSPFSVLAVLENNGPRIGELKLNDGLKAKLSEVKFGRTALDWITRSYLILI